MTPDELYSRLINRQIDTDGFPASQPYQCYDAFKYACNLLGIYVNTYCAITNFVDDLWHLRDQYGYYQFFDYVYDWDKFMDGDWIFWSTRHVAMYYHNNMVGQNQPEPRVTIKPMKYEHILGALRPKAYTQYPKGFAECYDPDIAGTYACMAPLNMRTGGDTSYHSMKVLPKGTRVQNYGYYHRNASGDIWLYVQYGDLQGFCCMRYLSL